MRIPLFQVDAFTVKPFAGNPAAVCLLGSWLDDRTLQKVAAENNMPATGFLVPSDNNYEIRWFTPICEIRLCGHATLAAAFIVFKSLNPEAPTVRLATGFSGEMVVSRDGDSIAMNFPSLPHKVPSTIPPDLARILEGSSGIAEFLEGNQTWVAVYTTAEQIQGLNPDLRQVESLHPFVFAATAPGQDVDFVSRYFAPSYGIPEDSVTGSLHCLLAPYWANRLGKNRLRARQLSERGGELSCEWLGERVVLKGSAVLIKQATLTI